MAALVETMFSVREKPWHGLGTIVAETPDSQTALIISGLDWNVIQKSIMTSDGNSMIPGFKASIRDSDNSILGIVTDRYKVVQNRDAFAFTDNFTLTYFPGDNHVEILSSDYTFAGIYCPN